MLRTRVSGNRYPNQDCPVQMGKITRHGFFMLRNGSRCRRYRCNTCGKETRTPAVQAGPASRQLSFREIFMSGEGMVLYVLIVIGSRSTGSRMKAA